MDSSHSLFPMTVLLLVVSLPVCSAGATGIYRDAPSYFFQFDTTSVVFTVKHSDIQRDEGCVTIFGGMFDLRVRSGTHLRLGLMYPAMQREWDIAHDTGYGRASAAVRILGDSLESTGLYARADAYIPVGSRTMYPFSYESFDVGGGIEYYERTSLFGYRASASYTMVGERNKEGSYENRNFLMTALSIDVDLWESTCFRFSVFIMSFRGGDSREVYLATFRQALSVDLDIVVDAALDAGGDTERIFNSLFSLGLSYRFQ